MTSIHHAAADGFSKQAEAYSRGRPEYPAALLPWLIDELGIQPAQQVLDLGAGTGKFTRLLIQTGARVSAVEPVDAMRQQLAQALPDVAALPGTAESIPLPDASVDVVACAQAFHWFSTKAALEEIRRVLKPGGKLVLVWNVRDETVDWVAEITRLITPLEGDTPRFHKGEWRTVFPAPGFGPLKEHTLPYFHSGPAERVILDRMLSVSFIAALPIEEQAQVRDALLKLIDTHPALAGRDEVHFPYSTAIYYCVRE
ncbi:MAG: methyltransferase domain-containing protein [Burkholderiales bacterium]|nr:methyltransferase domain-containing protein [Burkholderiales bacterium]